MNPGLERLELFRGWEWRSALKDAFHAGAETARRNPGVVATELWDRFGPADDPSSWEYDGDDTIADVLDVELTRRAFLLGVASVAVPRERLRGEP